ncbi:MAG: NnrU family protein [Bacteroidales bacterium]|jgi:protein-S-isoprenylcysteine O-methyltransferase Ste14
MNNCFLLSGLLILYCILHSLLISLPFTRFVKTMAGKYFCYYRLVYNVFSFVTLLPVINYAYTLKGADFFSWDGCLSVLRYLLIFTGIVLLVAGSRSYSFSQFTGLKQIRTYCTEENDSASDTLSTSGISRFIRHPWYTATIALLWSGDLDISRLIMNSVFTLYIIAGAFLEEHKLIKAFGDQYRRYRKEVSMFVPLKWIYKVIFTREQPLV